MTHIQFEQPTHPLSINEANRMHWAARRRRLDPWHARTFLYAKALEIDTQTEPVNIKLTLTFPRGGRRDPHNYVGTVVKTVVDALVRAGIVPDDTPDWVTVVDPEIRVAKDNLATITIERRLP
jgi:crossover junction endodeoxyribonuclease RusA